MLKLILRISILSMFFSAPNVFATADAADRMDKCSRSLLNHVQREGLDERRWVEFPTLAKTLERATMLIRIPLDGVTVPLTSLLAVLHSNKDFTIPDELRIMHDNALYFVVEGRSAGLIELHDRMMASLPKVKPAFQVLDAKATSFHLDAPKSIIQANLIRTSADKVAAEQAVAAEMTVGNSFALYLVDSGKVVFFSPRRPLEKLLESDLLDKEQIQVRTMRKTPVAWTAWVHSRVQQFEDRLVVQGPDWVILSPSAFHAVQLIESGLFNARPVPVSLEADMQQSLRRCFGKTVCEIEPSSGRPAVSAEPLSEENFANNLTAAGVKEILSFLKINKKSETGVTARGGLRRAWLSVGSLIKNETARNKFKTAVRSMQFKDSEYNMLMTSQPSARNRFALAWLEFLQARDAGVPDNPLSRKSIRIAIDQLEKDI